MVRIFPPAGAGKRQLEHGRLVIARFAQVIFASRNGDQDRR